MGSTKTFMNKKYKIIQIYSNLQLATDYIPLGGTTLDLPTQYTFLECNIPYTMELLDHFILRIDNEISKVMTDIQIELESNCQLYKYLKGNYSNSGMGYIINIKNIEILNRGIFI